MMKKKRTDLLSGDLGRTGIYSGEELSKNSLRIEAIGDLDELNCTLGVARSFAQGDELQKRILEIQQALFTIGSELATTDAALNKLKKRVDDAFLEIWIERTDSFKKITSIPQHFIIPGGAPVNACLDLARAVSRRCERTAVRLFEENEISNERLLIWFNRLSYYLYLLARHEEANPTLLKE